MFDFAHFGYQIDIVQQIVRKTPSRQNKVGVACSCFFNQSFKFVAGEEVFAKGIQALIQNENVAFGQPGASPGQSPFRRRPVDGTFTFVPEETGSAGQKTLAQAGAQKGLLPGFAVSFHKLGEGHR